MPVHIFTVPFDPEKGVFQDDDLRKFLLNKRILALRPEFFSDARPGVLERVCHSKNAGMNVLTFGPSPRILSVKTKVRNGPGFMKEEWVCNTH